nr:MAG: hypothetical protein [Microviridae sp.]
MQYYKQDYMEVYMYYYSPLGTIYKTRKMRGIDIDKVYMRADAKWIYLGFATPKFRSEMLTKQIDYRTAITIWQMREKQGVLV